MSTNLPDVPAFNTLVWEITRQVPHGIVTTYGQIASMIPCPEGIDPDDYVKLSPRWVGDAMNAVSPIDDGTIPWWRVINSKGGISLNPASTSGIKQRQYLEKEGVQFNAKGLVNFDEVGWGGPPENWRTEHGLNAPISLKSPPDDENNPKQMSLF